MGPIRELVIRGYCIAVYGMSDEITAEAVSDVGGALHRW